jgi:endonuclease YncB( thermonuclease family)
VSSLLRFALWSLVAALGSAAPSALSVAARPESATTVEPAGFALQGALPEQALRPGTGLAYRAELLRVIDGDTLEARVAIWLDQSLTTRIRLRDIDAPELSAGCERERARAVAARDRLAALVSGGALVVTDIGRDKYGGRVIARVETAAGVDVGRTLVGEGHARVWARRREAWC